VLVEEAMLPLADASLDRLLAVHCLEATERSGPLLREIWRVLKPEGRLLLVVPNRRGVWTRLDITPFGHGRPYSRGQLERLLHEALFTPLEWTGALFMPPIDRPFILRWSTVFERLGARMWPGFAGVMIVEARKELMGAIPAGAKSARRGGLATAQGTLKRCAEARSSPR
jgi:SAM-dependent methyltransferase